MTKIMFVCHGNICRSPMAEFIFKKLIMEKEVADRFIVASSGTSDEEIRNGVGNPVYPPARGELAKHGIDCGNKRAVQLTAEDGDQYDLFVCMDRSNLTNARSILKSEHRPKLRLLMSYTENNRDVSDPWYTRYFDAAYTDIYDGCVGLLHRLLEEEEVDKGKLFVSRPDSQSKSTALSPCDMTPDDVDYEMARGKDPKKLEICGMNQESFEYFVDHYGAEYEELYFFKCQLISDFSPLSKLKKLKEVKIFWNIRADRLWDMRENTALESIWITDCKKITSHLSLLNTGSSLKRVAVSGSMFNNTPLADLRFLNGLDHLEELRLHNIKLGDRNTDLLSNLPALQRFDFDAGMFPTEEIAFMCAKYPHLSGCCLCAYNTEDAILNDVRVCGFRKPELDLPKDQKRLDKYVAEFEAMVEKCRKELQI